MMMSSTASIASQRLAHEVSMEGDRLSIKATGDASELQAVVKILSDNKTAYNSINKVDLDLSSVSGQKAENLLPILACLLRWAKENSDFSSSITGINESVLSHSAIKPFSKISKNIELKGDGRTDALIPNRNAPYRFKEATPSPAQQNFTIERQTEAITVIFLGPDVKYTDVASAAQMINENNCKIVIDLQNCTSIKQEAALSFCSLAKQCPAGTALTILLKTQSNPDEVIGILSKNAAIAKIFGNVHRV